MKRTKEDSEKTRKAILNAAIRLFSEKGIERTTLEDIARGAAVTRGAIYWHFQNKAEIFDTLHQWLYCPVAETIMTDTAQNHPEPLEQLRQLCIQLCQDLEQDKDKQLALNLFIFKCTYSGDLAPYKDKHKQRQHESRQLCRRYFELAKENGTLPPHADPELLTLSIHCMLKGILYEYLYNPEYFNLSEQAPGVIDLFFKGICAKA